MSTVWPVAALEGFAAELRRLGDGRNARVRAAAAHHVHQLRLIPWMGRAELEIPLPQCGTSASFYDLSAIEFTTEPVDCDLCLAQAELGDLLLEAGAAQGVLFELP
ncbi:hypothetical protein [Longispora albida]|uniref:hypothetical protein n=1 Tax=Longispora albida TaxID=203523 RepID=UPI0012F8D205|nr:hypothetical protein [Longispora albida]